MIRFLFKGLIRDRQRSLLPAIVVAAGVTLTVLMTCYFTGVIGDFADFSAKFSNGHVRIMTRAYSDNMSQMPTDLSMINVNEILAVAKKDHPEMEWVMRIQFGGLLDAPDEKGETRAQGPAMATAVDLITPGSQEPDRLNLTDILVRGKIPDTAGEILISDDFATRLDVAPGDIVTLMGSTMYGEMCFYNFKIAGTIRFGVSVMDRGAIIVDLSDARAALDMDNAASEILGYLPGGHYIDEQAQVVCTDFNNKYSDPADEFSPVMLKMTDQSEMLKWYMQIMNKMSFIISFVFILAMSIVLWNTGLIGGLRRYGEVGIRLAIGESKGHVYKSMIYESVLIGIIGSVTGTVIGLLFSYLLQEKGIDISAITKGSTMMMPGNFHAKIIPEAYYVGFVPGLFSTTLGTMLSGIGIYKRKTAELSKELET